MELGTAHLAVVVLRGAGGAAAAQQLPETSAATPTGALFWLQLAAVEIYHTQPSLVCMPGM